MYCPSIWIDGKEVGCLKNGGFFRLGIDQGIHTLTRDVRPLEHEEINTVNFECKSVAGLYFEWALLGRKLRLTSDFLGGNPAVSNDYFIQHPQGYAVQALAGKSELESNGEISVHVVPPETSLSQRFPNNYMNVSNPDSDDWLTIKSTDAATFIKVGEKRGETTSAVFREFRLAPVETSKELMDEFTRLMWKDDSKRFETEESSLTESFERNYSCVRYHSIVRDNFPADATHPLLIEMITLFCKHPVQSDTAFEISYSHRGQNLDPNIGPEAEDFIKGVQIQNQ